MEESISTLKWNYEFWRSLASIMASEGAAHNTLTTTTHTTHARTHALEQAPTVTNCWATWISTSRYTLSSSTLFFDRFLGAKMNIENTLAGRRTPNDEHLHHRLTASCTRTRRRSAWASSACWTCGSCCSLSRTPSKQTHSTVPPVFQCAAEPRAFVRLSDC